MSDTKMSDTNNKKVPDVPDNIINYIVYGQEELRIVVPDGNKNTQEANVYNIPGIPMEIPTDDFVATNETPDGRVEVRDKTGKVIGYLDPDGTIGRGLIERDKKDRMIDNDTVRGEE